MFPQAAPSLPTENAVQCRRTTYGCCYDRTSVANGPNGEGCPNPPNHSKQQTRYYKLMSGFVVLLFFFVFFQNHMWICPVQTHSETLRSHWLKGLLTGFIVSMGKYAVYPRTPIFKLYHGISINPVFCYFALSLQAFQSKMFIARLHVGNLAPSVPLLQLSAPSAPCLVLPAPAATGLPATTSTSSPPSACTSGTEVATVTATTSWPAPSARGRARFLRRASRARAQSLPLEVPPLGESPPLQGPHQEQAPHLEEELEQVDPHLEGQQVEAHATWAGFSPCREARPAAPADRPQAPPHTPTEAESSALVGLPMVLLPSTPAQQRGKTLKTQGATKSSLPAPLKAFLPLLKEPQWGGERVSWRRVKHRPQTNHVHQSFTPKNMMMMLILMIFIMVSWVYIKQNRVKNNQFSNTTNILKMDTRIPLLIFKYLQWNVSVTNQAFVNVKWKRSDGRK